MPEGDALHRAAQRLQVLVGQQLEVETPHPRAAVKQLAPRLDGRRLENVEAIGKNLLLRFEGGLVLRSHLRMKGRWRVFRRDTPIFGQPWLVLRGDEYVGAMFNGAVLELDRGIARPHTGHVFRASAVVDVGKGHAVATNHCRLAITQRNGAGSGSRLGRRVGAADRDEQESCECESHY